MISVNPRRGDLRTASSLWTPVLCEWHATASGLDPVSAVGSQGGSPRVVSVPLGRAVFAKLRITPRTPRASEGEQ